MPELVRTTGEAREAQAGSGSRFETWRVARTMDSCRRRSSKPVRASRLGVSFLRERCHFDNGVGLLAHHANENLDDAGVKLRVGATLELSQGIRRAAALLIGAVAGDGVVGIRNRNNPGPQRDFFALEAVRISRAVEIFVMVK